MQEVQPVKPKPEPLPFVVDGECTYLCDSPKSRNRLVIQRNDTDKEYRIFVRPEVDDSLLPEPIEQWDVHDEPEQGALELLFTTYGKGAGTRIEFRHNLDMQGRNEFFLNVWPREEVEPADEDDAFPKVVINASANEHAIVAELFAEIEGTREEPDSVSLEESQTAIEDLLDEYDMPGDLPAHLDYTLEQRLRSIFDSMKRGVK